MRTKQLTMRLKKRWITSVLREAEGCGVALPWFRGPRRREMLAARAPRGIRQVSVQVQ